MEGKGGAMPDYWAQHWAIYNKIETHVKTNLNVNNICALLGCYAAYSGSYQRFGTTYQIQSSIPRRMLATLPSSEFCMLQ
jgi:hypothetical protein